MSFSLNEEEVEKIAKCLVSCLTPNEEEWLYYSKEEGRFLLLPQNKKQQEDLVVMPIPDDNFKMKKHFPFVDSFSRRLEETLGAELCDKFIEPKRKLMSEVPDLSINRYKYARTRIIELRQVTREALGKLEVFHAALNELDQYYLNAIESLTNAKKRFEAKDPSMVVYFK